MTGLALKSCQSLVLALLDLVAEAHLTCECPVQGRTTSHRRAADTPPGPVPTACRALSSPPSKSVTHGASHIPQLQEIQKAPTFLQLHMPPPCLSLKYFSCSRASLFLPSFQTRGKKHPHLLRLSSEKSPLSGSFHGAQQHGQRLTNSECQRGSYLVASCDF